MWLPICYMIAVKVFKYLKENIMWPYRNWRKKVWIMARKVSLWSWKTLKILIILFIEYNFSMSLNAVSIYVHCQRVCCIILIVEVLLVWSYSEQINKIFCFSPNILNEFSTLVSSVDKLIYWSYFIKCYFNIRNDKYTCAKVR